MTDHDEAIEVRLAGLERTLEMMMDALDPRGAQQPGPPTTAATDAPPPWRPDPLPEGIIEDPAVWVAWYASLQPVDRSQAIPPCWPEHPGLVAEVRSIWASFVAAFFGEQATAAAAQTWWHSYLPGFLTRIPKWAPSACRTGPHKST